MPMYLLLLRKLICCGEKEYTQEAIVEIVNTASESILIIITGKNIEERVPKLLKVLKETNIIHFEKKEK